VGEHAPGCCGGAGGTGNGRGRHLGCWLAAGTLSLGSESGQFTLPDQFDPRLQPLSFDRCTCEVRFLEVFAASGKLGVPHTAGYTKIGQLQQLPCAGSTFLEDENDIFLPLLRRVRHLEKHSKIVCDIMRLAMIQANDTTLASNVEHVNARSA
jgi:hypothetical protein